VPSKETRLFLDWLRGYVPDGFLYLLARKEGSEQVTRVFVPTGDLQKLADSVDELAPTHHVWLSSVTYAKSGRATKGNANATRLVWIDHDGDPEANPYEWDPPPHTAWRTSAGRYQAIWLLDAPIPKKETEALCAALATRFGGDPSGKDIVQVLRVPGTLNHKHDPPTPVGMLWVKGEEEQAPYNAEGLRDVLRVSPVSPEPTPEAGPTPPEGTRDHALYTLGHLNIPTEVVAEAFIKEQEDRSAALYRLMATLAEKGASSPEIYQIASHSANQKFITPARLWEDVMRTAAKVTPKAGSYPIQHASVLAGVDETLIWVVNPFLYDDAVATAVGEPSTRKSWAVVHLGAVVACPDISGYYGFPVELHGPVLYFDLDDRRPRRLKRRLGNILAAYREGNREFNIPFYFVSGDFNYTEARWQQRLRASLEQIQEKEGKRVVVTIIDTLHRAGFSPKDWGANAQPLLNGLADMANELRTAFIIVHHSAKVRETVQRNVRNAPWGSTFTGASLDPTWAFSRNFSEDDREPERTHFNLEVWSKEGPEGKPWILAYGKDPSKFEVEVLDADVGTRVLAELKRTGEATTQADLARHLGVEDQQVSRAISRLQEKGKVDVRKSGSAKLVSLPEVGGQQSEF